jgi:hypothetical protein
VFLEITRSLFIIPLPRHERSITLANGW